MCRPGVDQTGRMPQTWNILVPRLQQSYNFGTDRRVRRGQPSDFIFREPNNWDAWSKLARLPRALPSVHPHHRLMRTIITCATIESLPAEILSLILSSSSLSKSDIMAFGLASPILWPHVLQHVTHECKRSIAPWAGLEIANIGNYLMKLPESFEENSLFASSVGPIDSLGNMCTARRLNYKARSEFTPVAKSPQYQWRQAFDEALPPFDEISNEQVEALRSELLNAMYLFPHAALKAPWVLRDLTSKEYIRCRYDIESQRGLVETKSLRLPIEDALLPWISWPAPSRYDSLQLSPLISLREQCQWAGHTFDIVLAEEERLGMEMEGWKDVTADVVRTAKTSLERLEARLKRKGKQDEDYQLARAAVHNCADWNE